MGLEVLPPDINASEKVYRGIRRQIRIGFMQIKGLGEGAGEAVIEEREKGGAFRRFDSFLHRMDIDPSHIRLLIRAGAFDSIAEGASRPQLLWRLAEWKHGRSRSRVANLPLFREETTDPPEALPYDEGTVLLHEVETLGFLLSRHPLALYRERLKGLRVVSGSEMDRHVGREVNMIGWWVTGKMVLTRSEEPMEFVSFEDTTAIYEATFFPRTYARFCHMLSRQRPYLLRGKVEEDFGAAQLVVDDVRLL
jgi:error-prone DNA polymerase